MATVKIVGLGPSNYSYLSVGALEIIRSAPTVFVRTSQHPVVDELAAQGIMFKALDYIYESSDSFEEVYSRIADLIVQEALEHGEAVYAVPGHPLVGESSVHRLIRKTRENNINLKIIGSESFIEASLEALNLHLDTGLKILDALSLDSVAPANDVDNLIYQVYGRSIASEVKLKLMDYFPDDYTIMVISEAGTVDQKVTEMPLFQLDWHDWDHLTSLYVPSKNNGQR